MTGAADLIARGAAIARDPVKRAFDVAFAAAGLIVTAPVSLLAALAIKIDTPGPVFYAQQRSGLRGRPFTAWKFRSMVADADRDGARQAVAGDLRVTRAGRLLRAAALDEVPQLWNILRGDMSVVGPRALRPGEIEAGGGAGRAEPLEAVPGFEVRSAVRPGLTGIAQIYARRDLPRRRKFRYDRLYLRRQSTALDVRLVLLSLTITLLGSWERRGARRRAIH
ncbi:MAG TPA: sugar transferase [Vicinamibacterales bacterium]|nr:sugar transferase [Vicinamibacterales bacterium]